VTDRIPPNDLDAEQAVLSAILTVPEAYDRVEPILRAEHFYAQANARIFTACSELIAVGKPIDAVSVAGHLRDSKRLDGIGGVSYLTQIMGAPFVVDLEQHARRIFDKWRLRSVIAEGQTIVAEAYGDPPNVGKFVQQAEARMYAAAGEARDKVTSETARQVMGTCIDEIARRYRKEAPRGLSTSFRSLDVRIGGLRAGRMYACAGRPGTGKTSFALQAMRAVATSKQAKRGVYFASLEMPREQIGERFIAQETGLDTRKPELGLLTRGEWDQVAEAGAEIAKWPLVIDDQPGMTVSSLRSSIRRACRLLEKDYDTELALVALDYFQLIGTDDLPRGLSTNDTLEMISKGILQISKEFNVPFILLSQLNREVEKRPGKRPQLSDLRGSGALEQDAHSVIFFFREDLYRTAGEAKDRQAEFIIAKARGGRCGTVQLGYLDYCTKFVDDKDNDPDDEMAQYYDQLGDFAEDVVRPPPTQGLAPEEIFP
jgi:replicative DNA helicase